MKIRTQKPSPAMVVACMALFIALGGTSFAAVALTRNSVLSKHIKNGQVKRADLGANAVDSSKVADGLLLARDFAAGQLPKGDKGDAGERGPVGPTAGFRGGAGKSAADPSSTPETTIDTQSVSLPTAGRLLVLGRFTGQLNCSLGSENARWGLYVDGTAIPGSAVNRPIGGQTEPMTLVGMTDVLLAGSHSLQVRADCTNGDFTERTGFPDEAITAVLLGS